MQPAECRRCSKNHYIAFIKAIHCFFVTIEAEELTFLWYVQLLLVSFSQIPEAAIKTALENVGHSDKFDRTVLDRKGLRGCTGAPATTTNQAIVMDSRRAVTIAGIVAGTMILVKVSNRLKLKFVAT